MQLDDLRSLSFRDMDFIETIQDRIHFGSHLEQATKQALQKLSRSFKDLTKSLDFNTKHIPDFVLEDNDVVVECKNWRCNGKFSKYKIKRKRAISQIISRFQRYSNSHKILIIADPIFTKDASRLLMLCGIKIISLGYGVTKNTFNKAVQDITEKISTLFNRLSSIGPKTRESKGTNIPKNRSLPSKILELVSRIFNKLKNQHPFETLMKKIKNSMFDPQHITTYAEPKNFNNKDKETSMARDQIRCFSSLVSNFYSFKARDIVSKARLDAITTIANVSLMDLKTIERIEKNIVKAMLFVWSLCY